MPIINIKELKNTDVMLQHRVPLYIKTINVCLVLLLLGGILLASTNKIKHYVYIQGVVKEDEVNFIINPQAWKKINHQEHLTIAVKDKCWQIKSSDIILDVIEIEGLLVNIGKFKVNNVNLLNNQIVKGKILISENSIIEEIYNFFISNREGDGNQSFI